MLRTICKDPYRLFFPLASVSLIYAGLLWILFGFFSIGDMPIAQHSYLFMGGFLFFSILGFLLTAIPRFTQTDHLYKTELMTSFLCAVCVLSGAHFEIAIMFWSGVLTGFLVIIIFALRRFRTRKKIPPPAFLFVGLGIWLGFLGSLLHVIYFLSGEHLEWSFSWGKILFFDSMVTSFIIGIGSKLLPFIWGFDLVSPDQMGQASEEKSFLKLIPNDIFSLAILFVLSILLEGNGFLQVSSLLRMVVLLYVGLRYWKLQYKIVTGAWHGRSLKLACWFLLIGTALLCIESDYVIHIRHLIYIGCYCLMTLMVASRVLISHAGVELSIEKKFYPYGIVGFLVALAAITRLIAIFYSDSYLRHLAYAALVLLMAMVVWLITFAPLFFKQPRDYL